MERMTLKPLLATAESWTLTFLLFTYASCFKETRSTQADWSWGGSCLMPRTNVSPTGLPVLAQHHQSTAKWEAISFHSTMKKPYHGQEWGITKVTQYQVACRDSKPTRETSVVWRMITNLIHSTFNVAFSCCPGWNIEATQVTHFIRN